MKQIVFFVLCVVMATAAYFVWIMNKAAAKDDPVDSQETESEEMDEPKVEPIEDILLAHYQSRSDMPGYPPGGALGVTMPNGEKIRHRYATDTFVEVLEKIGLERIYKLDIKVRYTPLLSLLPNDNVRQRQSGMYHITVDTHSRYMSRILCGIAATFDIDLVIRNTPARDMDDYIKYPKRGLLDL